MDALELMPTTVDLSSYNIGMPQQSGVMTVLPVFGSGTTGKYSSPLSGLKLSKVKGYGNVEMENPNGNGLAIVPLHIGYIQHGAQNHALCSSAFIGEGQKRMFEDACCVQQSQGGYLEGEKTWFFILPVFLRDEALKSRGQKDYQKLWGGISRLNQKFHLPERGHLEQIISKKKAYLTQYRSRFETLPGQTGAMFFINDKLAGVEIAPTKEYFEEVWVPLVCFCYGSAAMLLETVSGKETKADDAFSADSLENLRRELDEAREARKKAVMEILDGTPKENFTPEENERYLDKALYTVDGENFSGQFVRDDERTIYVSIAAKPAYLM